MANTRSAAKRARQTAVRTLRNKATKTFMRTRRRKLLEAIEAGDKEAAEKALREAFSSMDKAVKTNVIHRNVSSRSKSRLSARYKAAFDQAPA